MTLVEQVLASARFSKKSVKTFSEKFGLNFLKFCEHITLVFFAENCSYRRCRYRLHDT